MSFILSPSNLLPIVSFVFVSSRVFYPKSIRLYANTLFCFCVFLWSSVLSPLGLLPIVSFVFVSYKGLVLCPKSILSSIFMFLMS